MTLPYRTIFFDVDSTLVTIEGIDLLSGGNPKVAALTEAAMNGRIPLGEVYGRRLDLIRPTAAAVRSLGDRYLSSIVPGATELVAALLKEDANIHLVTAGIRQAVLPLGERLGIPARAIHAVALEFDESGGYQSFDRQSPLTRSGGKELVVRDVRARTHGKAAFVGDGVTDLEAMDVVDLFIGFGGVRVREKVRESAHVYIEEPSLLSLFPILIPSSR